MEDVVIAIVKLRLTHSNYEGGVVFIDECYKHKGKGFHNNGSGCCDEVVMQIDCKDLIKHIGFNIIQS